ncbi:MAG: pitrilysin family protein [Saprospiraceae bacterium]
MTSMPSPSGLIFKSSDIDIPFKKYILSNGLRLIVHEDFKAPIVAVNIWYHVGSKNEKQGKSGFAHLFEHLMFNGSENFNTDYFQALEAIGATDLNGTTNNDRTNYFQNVPVGALEQVLWLESDRMGHLTGAIDQAKLDEQRGVVINEKKQGENQPYAKEDDLFTEAMFPKGHPYSWTVIGSEEDLIGATVADVHEWFKGYYGAANAILVIAGAIKVEEALEKVKKYFGHIPSGPMIARSEVDIPIRQSNTRQEFEDRVPESKITIAWNIPQWGTREAAIFDLIAAILGSDKNSRLYKRLIYENQWATSASAHNYSREICGNFLIECKIKKGVDEKMVEQEIYAVLSDFLANGPTKEELLRVKSKYFAGFIKGIERIGGFGGKSDVLAESEIFGDTPEYYRTYNEYIEHASLHDLQNIAFEWLNTGSHTILAKPFPEYETEAILADRAALPPVGHTPASAFPILQRTALPNGLAISLAPRPESPTVVITLMMQGGFSSDKVAGKPGLAALAMNMMDEGTRHLDALQISEQLSLLGASISSFADLDQNYIKLECLKLSLEPSLDLLMEILLHPSFPEADFERLKTLQISGIQREKMNPVQMALRVMPKFLFGTDHIYSLPMSGMGFEESVASITLEDVKDFYYTWIRPGSSSLSVVGDLSMDEIHSMLDARLAEWTGSSIPIQPDAVVTLPSSKILYLMHKPEVEQTVIMAGYLIAPYGELSEIAKEPLINVLGGDFTSRINLNLREDKHWTYGAGVFIREAKGPRPFITYTQVQIDKTKESIQEIIKEYDWIVGEKPLTFAEFEKTKNNQVMSLPGIWETNAAVAGSLNQLIKYQLADDYWSTYSDQVKSLSLEEVQSLGHQLIDSSKLVWFLVSNKDIILEDMKSLGFDRIIIVDSDGTTMDTIF